MKRHGNLKETILSHDNLRLAYWKAGRGRRQAGRVLAFGRNLDDSLARMAETLATGTFEFGRYHRFSIRDPKPRIICAAHFEEQVAHHALMNVCEPLIDRSYIHHTYACRKGRGTIACVKQAHRHTRRYDHWLKLDMRKFFDSIHHDTLKGTLASTFKDRWLLETFGRVIDSYHTEPGRGVPIGNLTSQHFSNLYLNGLDHFVTGNCRPGGYLRYMDDFVLWRDERSVLKADLDRVKEYTSNTLKLDLKGGGLLGRSAAGLPFLGFRLTPGAVRLSAKRRRRFIRTYKETMAAFDVGALSESEVGISLNSMLTMISHADTLAFRKALLAG